MFQLDVRQQEKMGEFDQAKYIYSLGSFKKLSIEQIKKD